MAILKYMLGNLRKRKSYSIVISLLVFLSGLILTVTVSTALNTFSAYDKAFNDIREPHLLYLLPESDYTPDQKNWFEHQSDVVSVTARQERLVVGAALEHDGTIVRNNVVLHVLVYNPMDSNKLIDAKNAADVTLTQGEIYLPYIYKTGNGLHTGDVVDYTFGGQRMRFTVAGFVEEPLFGAELHGAKLLFISDADMATLEKLGGESVVRNRQIRVRMGNYSEAAALALANDFVREQNVSAGTAFTYGVFANGHITLPKISLVVMIAFVLILCVITITIMRYAILAMIETDFTNIGVLKALGFTPGMVQAAITGQYALLALFSGLISLMAAWFLTPVVGAVILNSTGLVSTLQLSPVIGVAALTALVLVITLFSAMTARRTKRISPVQAIAQGIAPVYFSSRANIKLERLGWIPFNMRMALKQILTKSKRYVLLLLVSALLTYTLVFLLGLVQMFNSEKSLNMLGGVLSDIRVSTTDRQTAIGLIDQIQDDYATDWVYFQKTTQIVIDGSKTTVRVMDDIEASGQLSTTTGRHPRHQNEVAVSELLADRFQKGVGDTLMVKDVSGIEHPFLITGLFQTIDDGGTYVRMLESGILTLNPDFQLNTAYIKMKSNENLDAVIGEMQQRYTGYEEIANERKFANDKIGTIQGVFSQISKLVFVLTVVIIGFITLLIVKITVYSELRELGIYKAVGFSSARLRLQLALRFLMITVLGGAVGVTVESLYGSKLFSMLMKGFGLSSIQIDFSLMNALVPVAAIAAIAVLSAYISSKSVKTVSAYSLIKE